MAVGLPVALIGGARYLAALYVGTVLACYAPDFSSLRFRASNQPRIIDRK